MISLLVGIFALGSFIFLIIVAVRAARKNAQAPAILQQKLYGLSSRFGGQSAGDQVSIQQGGRTFFVKLTYAKKNQPPTLEVWTEVDDSTRDPGDATGAYRTDPRVKVLGRPEVMLRRETGRDRLGKRLRINREVDTGDEAFDSAVYIESYASDEDVKRVLGDRRARDMVARILDQDFTRVVVNKDTTRLAAVQIAAKPSHLEPDTFVKVTEALSVLAMALPVFEGQARPKSMSVPALVTTLGSLVGAIAGFIAFAVCQGRYRPLDDGAGWTGFLMGLVAYVVVTPLVGWFVRGRSDSFRIFLFSICCLLVAVPMWAMTATIGLNGALDETPPEDHPTRVTRMWITTGKNSTTYHLALEDWNTARGKVELPVDSGLYQTLSIGAPVIATTGRGRFGWEWLRRLRKGSSSQLPPYD